MNIDYSLLFKINSEFGDSFYLLDSNKFRDNYYELLSSFRYIYPDTFIGYSYKTNYIPKLCKIIDENGGFAEVVSEMEYDLAVKIGVNPKNIIVNGPYKTKANLQKYFKNGSLVNLDSKYEIEYLKEITVAFPNLIFRVGIRCSFILTDSYISRFGFDVDSETFIDTFNELKGIRNVLIEGIHCHFPDRRLDWYEIRVEKMLTLANELFENPPKYIDIGGGYFGKMPESLANQFNISIPSYKDYAQLIAGAFSDFYKNTSPVDKPRLFIEPGSAIVADTMQFVAKVIDIKKSQNKYIAISSGSKFNMGSFASQLNLPFEVYSNNNLSTVNYDSIDISGFTCIESDYLYKNYNGIINKSDYLVFSNVGSYSIVFKPPFILPNFPILEIDSGNKISVIKRKETMDYIFSTYNFD